MSSADDCTKPLFSARPALLPDRERSQESDPVETRDAPTAEASKGARSQSTSRGRCSGQPNGSPPTHLPSTPTLAHRSPTATLLFSATAGKRKETGRASPAPRHRHGAYSPARVRSVRGVVLKPSSSQARTAFDFSHPASELLCSAFT